MFSINFWLVFRSSVNKEQPGGQTCLYLFATPSDAGGVLWVQSPGQSENLEDHMEMCPNSYGSASSKKANGNIFLSGGETITVTGWTFFFFFFLTLARRTADYRPDRLISGVFGAFWPREQSSQRRGMQPTDKTLPPTPLRWYSDINTHSGQQVLHFSGTVQTYNNYPKRQRCQF